jgi:hypothetical protein
MRRHGRLRTLPKPKTRATREDWVAGVAILFFFAGVWACAGLVP